MTWAHIMCFGLPAPLMEVQAFIATSFLINTDALRLGKRLSEHRITRKNTIFSLRRILLAAIDASDLHSHALRRRRSYAKISLTSSNCWIKVQSSELAATTSSTLAFS